MAVSIDDFKKAFAGKVSPDVVSERDQQAAAALRLYKQAVNAFPVDFPIAEDYRQDLVGLVKQYDTLKKSNPPAQDLLTQLDDICQHATLKTSEVAQANLIKAPGVDLQPQTNILPTTVKNASRTTPKGPTTGPDPPSPTPTTGEAVSIDPAEVKKIEDAINENGRKVDDYKKRSEALRKGEASAKSPKEKLKLQAEREALKKEAAALMQEAEILATQVVKLDQSGYFKGANGQQALEKARVPPKGPVTLRGLGVTLVVLAAAYFIVKDIKYILEADSALEALERVGQVGGKYATSAAEFAVIKLITGSNLAAMGVQFLLALDDRSSAQRRLDEQEAQRKAEEKQKREQDRAERLAIGRFLEENVPGVVEWLEDHYRILNQKVYDEAVKKIRQMQKQHAEAKREAYRRAFNLGLADGKAGNRTQNKELLKFPELQHLPGGGAVTLPDLYIAYERGFTVGGSRQRAHDLGVNDARIYGRFVSNGEIKTWEAVKSGVMREEELFLEYRDAFQERNKTRTKAMERARELGYTDGKTGTKAHIDDIFKWPEVGKLIKDGAIQHELFTELAQNYTEAFEIKTGKRDPYEGLRK